MHCSQAGVSARFFWEMDSRVLWSDSMVKDLPVDLSSESPSSEDDSKHLPFYVCIMTFSFSEGFAGKGNRFVK